MRESLLCRFALRSCVSRKCTLKWVNGFKGFTRCSRLKPNRVARRCSKIDTKCGPMVLTHSLFQTESQTFRSIERRQSTAEVVLWVKFKWKMQRQIAKHSSVTICSEARVVRNWMKACWLVSCRQTDLLSWTNDLVPAIILCSRWGSRSIISHTYPIALRCFVWRIAKIMLP